jgi:hypothetical protein
VDERAGKIAAPEHSNQAGAKLVEDYLSERQQIDQVRIWLKENAPWAVTGILIGVGALFGWQQFQAWRERQALTGGEKYSQTLEALARNDRDAATRLEGSRRARARALPRRCRPLRRCRQIPRNGHARLARRRVAAGGALEARARAAR